VRSTKRSPFAPSSVKNQRQMPSIHNAKLVLPESVIPDAWISFVDGTISGFGQGPSAPSSGSESFDAQGLYLAPGFIDIHVHGGGGADFLDATPEAIETISRFHAAGGTTALAPTAATATYRQFERVLGAAERAATIGRLLPAHLEGPHLAVTKAGAQDKTLFTPPNRNHTEWVVNRASQISTITVAPELPGAIQFIRAGADAGILMSAGHSDATDEEVRTATGAGLQKVTHLFNAMSSAKKVGLFRVAGLLEFALGTPELFCEVLADGFHVSPTLLRLAYRAKGPDRLILVTDALAGSGQPVGSRFHLGNYACKVGPGYSLLEDESALAGSIAHMINLVRNMTTLAGVPLYEAVRMASLTPAKALKRSDELGSLESGKAADFVLFDDQFQVHRTIVRGETVFAQSESRR
jgi:N-acetylglucosamine-6-phosphate deacetylase